MPGRGHRARLPHTDSPVQVPQLLLQRGPTRQTSRRPFDKGGVRLNGKRELRILILTIAVIVGRNLGIV
eukprot:8344186-Pyramimonas_sp.AAC.1